MKWDKFLSGLYQSRAYCTAYRRCHRGEPDETADGKGEAGEEEHEIRSFSSRSTIRALQDFALGSEGKVDQGLLFHLMRLR